MPCVSGGSTLFAPAVDICHGVGATLNVGAVQEGPAVVANFLHPVQYQIGFSSGGKDENKVHQMNSVESNQSSISQFQVNTGCSCRNRLKDKFTQK